MQEILQKKNRKQLLDTGLNFLNTAFKKVVHKAGEFLGSKIESTVAKSNDNKIVKPNENLRNVEEIVIPIEKREKIINEF